MYKALIISAMFAGCALGQTTVTVQRPLPVQMSDVAEFGQVAITTALAGPMANVTGAPYSAQATTERVQVLADGNRILQTTSGTVARDSQGRVRREESLPGLKTNNGEAPHIVMIDDPVAQVHWTVDAQTKTAIKMPFKKGPPPSGKDAIYAVANQDIASTKMAVMVNSGDVARGAPTLSSVTPSKDVNATKTDLGSQNIEGVPAKGTRITRTIPAGQIGNEQPLVITTETWYSPDLKVLVMSKSSDPRMDDTTYTLTDIQRSEPDPTLFQVPEDYTIKDASGPVVQIQKHQ